MGSLIDADVPVGLLAALIFFLRITDVSLGTMRTLMVVNGRLRLSVVFGFFEVLIWLTSVSQVILRLREHPVLILAYASGFAAGNAVGIVLERKLAVGQCVVRMISKRGDEIAAIFSNFGRVLGLFHSEINGSPNRLVFATLARRDLQEAVRRARATDPEVFYVVDRFSETNYHTPLPHVTGWRAIFKKK